jgi:arylsulfatase A-like enzyme
VKGIPVTLAYVADLHDSQVTGNALGPGDAAYVAQAQSYDVAFDWFFKRLNDAGINETNTLFIITADEGDHFVGTAPTPANCDGVTVACQYDYTKVGELDLNINGLVAAQTGNTTAFDLHSDMAPTIYVDGNPGRTSQATRQLERDFAKLTALNPITNKTDHLAVAFADPVEMGLLHMITADPARTPSFTMFGHPDYWLTNSGPITPVFDVPVNGNAWNHGGIQREIANIWLGMVGPGVQKQGEDDSSAIEFSDHTDVRPTVLALLGLHDDYSHDGRVLLEALKPSALPDAVREHFDSLVRLGRAYKEINAPFGDLAKQTLKISTAALVSNAPSDAVYTSLENKLEAWRDRRDALVNKMRDILEGAAFGNTEVNEDQAEELIEKANALLDQVRSCAADTAACAK